MKAELLTHFGDDLMVINAARVSYGKSKSLFDEKDAKLIKYLVEHKHTAPFRHPQLQFRVECPIFVERQLFKHQIGMCLSGDTKITFIKGNKGHNKIRIEDLFNRWTQGRKHQPTPKDAIYSQKRIKGMKLRTLNESNQIFEISHIKNITFSGKRDVFSISLENGKQIKCSADHRVYTQNGYKTINSGLNHGDFVGCNGVKVVGTGMYRDKNHMKSLREQGLSVQAMAESCGCGYDNIRKWLKIHKLCFSKKETCFQKNAKPWNAGKTGYKLNLSEESRKKKSILGKLRAPKGKESRFWRGGVMKERDLIGQWTRSAAGKLHRKYNYTCQKCGMSCRILHAHHIVPVSQDISKAYSFENLISVCEKCHKNIHSSLENEMEFAKSVLSENFVPFEYAKRINRKLNFTSKIHFSKITSIQHIGIEKTYDIEVEGQYKNFVANGIVVHNSANSISGRYVDFSDKYFTFNKLRKQSKSSKQGSEGELIRPDLLQKIQSHVESSASLYKELCEAGCAKEQSRAILPLCLETQFIWTGSFLAFIHFWNLRLKPDTQEETREIAAEMLRLVKNIEGNPFQHSLTAFGL